MVTAPGSSDSPVSRRAAREQREEAARRARRTAPEGLGGFVLPEDEDAPPVARAPEASPFLLPAEVRAAVAQYGSPATRATSRSRVSAQPGALRRSRRTEPMVRESARRAARAERLLTADGAEGPPSRHVRPRFARGGVALLIAVGGALLLGSTAAVTALVSGGTPDVAAQAQLLSDAPPSVSALPVPVVKQMQVAADICGVPEVMSALEAHDDAGAITAAGGAESFRSAVAEGRARCVDLGDPTRVWTVVNKARPYSPVDYRPTGLVMPDGVRSIEGGALRSDAASALTAMVTAAREAGVGEIALESGFRSYSTQQGSYGRHVDQRGQDGADLVSARPGHSEHQSGLAGDVVACAGGCGTLDDLAATAQGAWIVEHGWEHGWIVRYVAGATGVTGYSPEPWHLRYIGPELSRAYHDGGWTSLEEFFGLEPAPGYVG
ncbi:M15 family metallopeptidase [Microbacterium sp. NPDC056003]|uniref:M15 family metallopeptidase n=1 Tax=Microbacterium sp. NPDC056003 TaxID=3345676 RepID=UPI0035E2164D